MASVLARSPIDTDAGNRPIKRMAHESPVSFYRELVELGGGLMLEKYMLAVAFAWIPTTGVYRGRIHAVLIDVRFSNRPVGVKRFQAIHHHYDVDVAHGLVLLFGIGTKALPSWGSKTRWNNLWVGLAVRLTVGPSGHANSPHPSSREGHHSTARWSSRVLLS